MRQIFTVRFLAAIAAVAGLLVLLSTVFATSDAIVGTEPSDEVILHGIDFVEIISSVTDPTVKIVDGVSDRPTDLIIDPSRTLHITHGAAGEVDCKDLARVGSCPWWPICSGKGWCGSRWSAHQGPNTVRLPAIDTLDEGIATLVNGRQVPYAPVLDRRCPDDDFASSRELRAELGSDFVSVFDTVERRLVAVECRRQVDYL